MAYNFLYFDPSRPEARAKTSLYCQNTLIVLYVVSAITLIGNKNLTGGMRLCGKYFYLLARF